MYLVDISAGHHFSDQKTTTVTVPTIIQALELAHTVIALADKSLYLDVDVHQNDPRETHIAGFTSWPVPNADDPWVRYTGSL